jgi:hypothetical protein
MPLRLLKITERRTAAENCTGPETSKQGSLTLGREVLYPQ